MREMTFENLLVTMNQVDVTPDLKYGACLRQCPRLEGRKDVLPKLEANRAALTGRPVQARRLEIHAASRFPSR